MSALTGGCQCGAVRFRIDGELGRASLCHCRMCQKAFGSAFGPLVSAKVAEITWTRGERALFQSSETIKRGFCAACGTPLTYEWSAEVIEMALGAFDDPRAVPPVVQTSLETALPWAQGLAIPSETKAEIEARRRREARTVSRQHPDHDTAAWPPADD